MPWHSTQNTVFTAARRAAGIGPPQSWQVSLPLHWLAIALLCFANALSRSRSANSAARSKSLSFTVLAYPLINCANA
jgi:hypothetical protein